MKIEVGKAYRTRDKRRAVIEYLDSDGWFNGRICDTDISIRKCWLPSGLTRSPQEDPLDLIAEWVDPVDAATPDKSEIPSLWGDTIERAKFESQFVPRDEFRLLKAQVEVLFERAEREDAAKPKPATETVVIELFREKVGGRIRTSLEDPYGHGHWERIGSARVTLTEGVFAPGTGP